MQREDEKKEHKINEMEADKVKKELWELGAKVKEEERTKERWRGNDMTVNGARSWNESK